MSAVSAEAVVSETLERAAPLEIRRRERMLPIFIVLSLVVHATIILPSLFRRDADEAATRQATEIPVEIVQLPPKAAERPKPPEQKPPAAQKPRQQAQKPPPKRQQTAHKPTPKQAQPQQQSGAERLKQLLGPMPAIALPGASADGTESVAYSQLVLSKVAKAKKEGRYKGVPGAASVAFTIGDAGEVVTVAIVRPSGDQTLDDEAVAMVKRGAPYPPPPPGGRRDYAITLRFQPLI